MVNLLIGLEKEAKYFAVLRSTMPEISLSIEKERQCMATIRQDSFQSRACVRHLFSNSFI